MSRLTIVYGTRPEAIKIAPLLTALSAYSDIEIDLVSTGQHTDLLLGVEDVFELRPGSRIQLKRSGGNLNELFASVMSEVDRRLEAVPSDLLLVQGDTTSAVAAGLAAVHRRIPVVHLEAGLRSFDNGRPFPEEHNRRILAQLADLHLAPTWISKENLQREGINKERIVVTGNTVVDALRWASAGASAIAWPEELRSLEGLSPDRKVILATLHRRESQQKDIAASVAALREVLRAAPELYLVFVLHRSPAAREPVLRCLRDEPNALLIEAVDYLTMVKLLRRAWVVVTDSGGLQEEAPAFGVPVLVVRDTTERPEAAMAGASVLVGGGGKRLASELIRLLTAPASYGRMAQVQNPFGDGHAGDYAAEAIANFLKAKVRLSW